MDNRDEQRAPEYDRNLLESCANWLDGHAYTVWAREFGHTGLMQTYARDLRAIRERMPAPRAPAVLTTSIDGLQRQIIDGAADATRDQQEKQG